MLYELGVGEPAEEMAEADDGGEECHDPGIAEAKSWGVETVFCDGRSGDLVEGLHIGSVPSSVENENGVTST